MTSEHLYLVFLQNVCDVFVNEFIYSTPFPYQGKGKTYHYIANQLCIL